MFVGSFSFSFHIKFVSCGSVSSGLCDIKASGRQEAGSSSVVNSDPLSWIHWTVFDAHEDLFVHLSSNSQLENPSDVFLHLCGHMKRFRGIYFERISEQEAANQRFSFLIYVSFLSFCFFTLFCPFILFFCLSPFPFLFSYFIASFLPSCLLLSYPLLF